MRESTTRSDNPSAPKGPISKELLRAAVRNNSGRKLFVDNSCAGRHMAFGLLALGRRSYPACGPAHRA